LPDKSWANPQTACYSPDAIRSADQSVTDESERERESRERERERENFMARPRSKKYARKERISTKVATAHATSNQAKAAHKKMIGRLTALERAVSSRLSSSTGIGRSRPSEPIESPPLDRKHLKELKNLIAMLKAQPAKPAVPPIEASVAASKLMHLGERVAAHAAIHADRFAAEFEKSAGKIAGEAAIQPPKWGAIGSALMTAGEHVVTWIALALAE
jgi:hypothetical protein